MRSPNDRRHRISVDYLLLLNEASSSKIGLHSIELLVKGVPWESSNNPGCC